MLVRGQFLPKFCRDDANARKHGNTNSIYLISAKICQHVQSRLLIFFSEISQSKLKKSFIPVTHLKFSQYEQNLTTKFLLSLDFFRTIYDCLKWFTLRYNTIKLFFILSHALLSNKHLVIYDCTVYAMHSICLAFSMCSFVIRFYFFLYRKN